MFVSQRGGIIFFNVGVLPKTCCWLRWGWLDSHDDTAIAGNSAKGQNLFESLQALANQLE